MNANIPVHAEKQEIEARAKAELQRVAGPFCSVHSACNLLRKENEKLRKACKNLLNFICEQDAEHCRIRENAQEMKRERLLLDAVRLRPLLFFWNRA